MWDTCTSCWMVMYIGVYEAINTSSFQVSTPCYYGEMFHRHAINLSLYPTIIYSKESDHSVTVGILKTMLFIINPYM